MQPIEQVSADWSNYKYIFSYFRWRNHKVVIDNGKSYIIFSRNTPNSIPDVNRVLAKVIRAPREEYKKRYWIARVIAVGKEAEREVKRIIKLCGVESVYFPFISDRKQFRREVE